MSLAYLNGDFVHEHQLTLGYADAGFVEGATITDFCRTYDGRLSRWDDHCDRFERDCATLGIVVPESRIDQLAAALGLLESNHRDGEDAAVIRFATPGPLRRLNPNLEESRYRPTFGMHTIALPADRYAHIASGAKLHLAGTIGAGIVPVHVKHRSRLAWRLADAAAPPGSVAVLIDDMGRPDTSIAAVLAIVDNVVVRPPLGTVLESVSFLVVRDLCRDLGIKFCEGNFDLRDPCSYDALLLAGTGFGLAPVAAIGNRPLPEHPVVERMIAAVRR